MTFFVCLFVYLFFYLLLLHTVIFSWMNFGNWGLRGFCGRHSKYLDTSQGGTCVGCVFLLGQHANDCATGFHHQSPFCSFDNFSGGTKNWFFSDMPALDALQGTVKGGRRQGRLWKRWEDNIREWTGLQFAKSQRAVENREKWRKLVVKSSEVPQRPSPLKLVFWALSTARGYTRADVVKR